MKARLKAILAAITSDLRYMWLQDHMWIVIITIGIVLVKGTQIAMGFLALKTKVEVNQATKKSDALQTQETKANDEANLLVTQADDLPGQENTVTDPTWDTKK